MSNQRSRRHRTSIRSIGQTRPEQRPSAVAVRSAPIALRDAGRDRRILPRPIVKLPTPHRVEVGPDWVRLAEALVAWARKNETETLIDVRPYQLPPDLVFKYRFRKGLQSGVYEVLARLTSLLNGQERVREHWLPLGRVVDIKNDTLSHYLLRAELVPRFENPALVLAGGAVAVIGGAFLVYRAAKGG